MAEPRSAAQEAGDPSTSPDRLLELTEKHPQLQRTILLNPSCPEVARQWILATNPWAKRAYEESLEQKDSAPESSAPEASAQSTSEQSPVEEGTAAEEPPEAAGSESEDPAAVSAWGDFGDDAFWDEENSAVEPEPTPPTSSVKIARDAGVVPLGPAPSLAAAESPAAATPAPAPTPAPAEYPDYAAPATPGAYDAAGAYGVQAATSPQQPQGQPQVQPQMQGQGQSPQTPYAAAAPVPSSASTGKEGSGPSRRIWWACGGCLLLSLLLVIVIAFAGRAWLSADDDGYERDSSTTAQETPVEEPSEAPAEETPSQDPVSPAPDGAQEMTELRSPTGNIVCLLEEDSVSCSVLERDFGDSGLEDCEDGPFSIQVADGEAAPACGSSFLSDSATALDYDQSATHGDVACTSRFDGMTCWNIMTGKGFMVNRVTYEAF
ncbi:hypothetical protein GCM10023160_29560 [Brachybacterium paraconglomeratum]|uniref:variant leucine-rich repeat-containing protein n=1 Tax=Brachybacterium paraconglomeratum TaxID=173362 RepID=UPI0031EDBCAD